MSDEERPERGPFAFDDPAPHPCEKCPYRRDAPRGLWSPQEFVDLVAADRDVLGKVYGCHKQNGQVCGGWLNDQRRRDFPSIVLRLRMHRDPQAAAHAAAAHDGGHRCFRSIEAMCRANGVPIADRPPDPWAERVKRPRRKRAAE